MKPYYQDDAVTLYCGDALELLPELAELADVLVTDPPYGMVFRSGRAGTFGDSRIANDEDTSVRDRVLELWGFRPALVFGRWSVPRPVATRMVLTWEKGGHVGMGDLSLPWKPNTEEVYVLGTGFEGRRSSSVIRCNAIAGFVGRAQDGTRLHPTEKPVALLRDLISKCPPGVILDPFAGSCSTLRAAKDLGRRAIGIEQDERYCRPGADRLRQEVLALD
jgi:DNA modification methylase